MPEKIYSLPSNINEPYVLLSMDNVLNIIPYNMVESDASGGIKDKNDITVKEREK